MKLRCLPWVCLCVLRFLNTNPALAAEITVSAASEILRPGPDAGQEFKASPLQVGPCMDVAVAGEHAFAIGQGDLRVLTPLSSGQPRIIAQLQGLGNTRQIALHRGHAFITSREDGLWIVDVREAAQPKLVHHYDTAELATAIALSGDVAAIGNRFAGIELLDVSQPAQPKSLGSLRVGEVQSLVFHGSWLYAGTWSEKAVAVIDAANPWQPRLVNTLPLDGKGDGLDVQGHLLAVATGHHARGKGWPKPGDAVFGHGHGVEFFDLGNPANPRRLSGLKFPPFYRLGMDMWGVQLAGQHALVNDTHNGFFLIDISDPTQPRQVGWTQLPKVGRDPSPVAGLALAKGRVLLAGAADDLHLVETTCSASSPEKSAGLKVPAKPANTAASALPAHAVDGSVRNVWPLQDDLLLLAAGSVGWQILQQSPKGLELLATYPTRGFARDVAMAGQRIAVAESLGGLSIWQWQPGAEAKCIARYESRGKSISQVVLADEGRLAFLAVGPNRLEVISMDADGHCRLLLEETARSGLFYRDPISPLSADGRRLLVQWHSSGLHEYLIENGSVKRSGWIFPHPMDTECGAAPWGEGWLVTSRRGLFALTHGESRSPEEIGLLATGSSALAGKPFIVGKRLFIADPFLGKVSALELSGSPGQQPQVKLKAQQALSGHPGRVKWQGQRALIPAGREGLLLWQP